MDFSFNISGLKELEETLNKLASVTASKVVRRAMRKGAKIFETAAESAAPVKSGRLKKNIKVRELKAEGFTTAFQIKTDGSVFYGKFSEFGTESQPARPWFRPAFESNKEVVAATVIDEMRKGIMLEAKKLSKPLFGGKR